METSSAAAVVLPVPPDSLWRELEITHAAEMCDFGKLMKAFRELQTPMVKQNDLARALGMTQGQISRIESGKSAVTDLSKLQRWAEAMRVPSSLLWFKVPTDAQHTASAERASEASKVSAGDEEDGVDRRQFLKTAVASSAAAPAATSRNMPAVGSSDVERLKEWTDNFRRMDNRWGAGDLIEQATLYAERKVVPILQSSRMTGKVRNEFHRSAAQLFQLLGWMHYDTNDRVQGKRALNNAYKLAERADDFALAAEMQAGISHQASFLGLIEQAEDAALSATHHARLSKSMSVQSEASIMEAHTLAMQGNARGTLAALSEAEDLFCRARASETPDWHQWYDRAYLDAKCAHVLRDLGQPAKAEPYARSCLHMSEGYDRGRAFNLCLLAGVLADKGELEEATTHAELALQMTGSIRSFRMQRYLADVARRLAPYKDQERVRRYLRQLSQRGVPLGPA